MGAGLGEVTPSPVGPSGSARSTGCHLPTQAPWELESPARQHRTRAAHELLVRGAAPHGQASYSLGCFDASHGVDLVGPGRALSGCRKHAKGPCWQHVRRSTMDRISCRFRLRLTIRRIGRLVIYYPHAIGNYLCSSCTKSVLYCRTRRRPHARRIHLT